MGALVCRRGSDSHSTKTLAEDQATGKRDNKPEIIAMEERKYKSKEKCVGGSENGDGIREDGRSERMGGSKKIGDGIRGEKGFGEEEGDQKEEGSEKKEREIRAMGGLSVISGIDYFMIVEEIPVSGAWHWSLTL